jgi:hypothetical protein
MGCASIGGVISCAAPLMTKSEVLSVSTERIRLLCRP